MAKHVSSDVNAPSRGFLRAVAVLVSGTAGAHLLTAVAMPVISRMYSPADFGVLAAFSGIVTTVAVAACLRFDVALALPREDAESVGLLFLALTAALAISTILLIGVSAAPSVVGSYLPHGGNYLLPFAVFGAAALSALQSWSIRRRDFAFIAKVRFAQAGLVTGTQLAGGLVQAGPLGLLLGVVAGSVGGVLCLIARIFRDVRERSMPVSAGAVRALFFSYSRFPIYSTWEALANQAAIHLPVVLIATAVAPAEAGYLMLAMYVMQAPMSLIGSTVAQVYLSRAPETHREHRLGDFTVDVLKSLVKAGVGPLLLVGITLHRPKYS